MDLGFPISLVEEMGEFIASSEVQLNPGDVVVLYTDGIPEAFDINKAQYGLKRLWQVVVENRHRRAREIREAVIDDVRQYIGAMKVFNDIAILNDSTRYQEEPGNADPGGRASIVAGEAEQE